MPEAREVDRSYARARALIAESRKGAAEALEILRKILPHVTHARSRGAINQQIWDCERTLGRHPHFFSQSGQDAWLERSLFKGKEGGVFVEIGGYDGVTGSNCL